MTQPTTTDRPDTVTYSPTGWAPPVVPPQAPPAKRKIGRYIVGGVVALFIVAGLAGSGGGDKKDARSSDGVVTAPTTASAPAATTPPTAASAPASLSMAAWASRYGSPDASQIGDDLTALQGDAEAMDLSSMASSCRTMQRHVATAKSHLPTPDAQLTSALRSAYGYYDQAMTVCISGAANMDVADLTQMTSYISMATGSLQEATARMGELN